MLQRFKERYIGDREFYSRVLLVAVPIMVQNGITNFVSMLDNIMVGQIGTEQMSGVSIVNQLIFVYNLCIFGGLAGAGIFTAQYYGTRDYEHIRHTFRFKFWMSFILTSSAIVLFLGSGDSLIQLYLNGSSDGGDLAAALLYGTKYLKVMLWGMPPFMLLQVYASTLRECGQTVIPMKAGLLAVAVNLTFNYLLIYGKFGFPQLGVVGAALATALARYVEALYVVIWTHMHADKNPYISGIYRTMTVPIRLAGMYFAKGFPLLINETMWSAGIAFLAQCYSVRGLSVVAGHNISNTIGNVFNVVFLALGSSVAIIVGQLLGANKMEEAISTNRKLIAFSVMSSFGIAVLMFAFAPIFPKLYNTTDQARTVAMHFIMIQALFMPMFACIHACYFSLRSGGKVFITFLFDSFYTWAVNIPTAYILIHYTSMSAASVLIAVHLTDMLKTVVGIILVKKGVWVQNIVQ